MLAETSLTECTNIRNKSKFLVWEYSEENTFHADIIDGFSVQIIYFYETYINDRQKWSEQRYQPNEFTE